MKTSISQTFFLLLKKQEKLVLRQDFDLTSPIVLILCKLWYAFGKYYSIKKLKMQTSKDNSLTLSLKGAIHWLSVTEIVYLQAQGSCTIVKMNDGKEYKVSKNTAHIFQQIPDNYNFIKAHRSWIVNSAYLQRLELNKVSKKYFLYLIGGFTIPLAKSNKKEFLESLQKPKAKFIAAL